MHRVRRKWRPPLALVIGGTLAAVLLTPVIGLVYWRLWGNILGWGEAAWLVVWLAVVATIVLGLLLWRLVLRPVYALTRYARARQHGTEAAAPTQFGTPELSALGDSIMAMGDSLTNRAEGMRAYANHVTHELKSPLAAIRGAAELLQDGAQGTDAAALSVTITEAATRMQALLDALARQALASEHPVRPGTCVVSEALDGFEAPLPVELAVDGAVPLSVDDLRTVLTQLGRNACENGASKVNLRVVGHTLIVADNGSGIGLGNRSRIFDPFFTTRREDGGTGMGLSIVRSLLQARGGYIRLGEADAGAVFIIAFDNA